MGLRPVYRLLANQEDLTNTIRRRLISLRYTDEAGLDSDVLEIVLADNEPDHPIEIPPTGAELELYLGYDDMAERIGLFIADEVELSGWPGQMTIRARAAPFEKSKAGKINLQSQKTRDWDAGTMLGDVVKAIASEHGLIPAVAEDLASVVLPHLAQIDESDINFLSRVIRRYDAVIKPAGGKLALAKIGEAKTVGGRDMSTVTLTPSDVSSWRVSITKRETSGSVIACWHETEEAKRHEVQVGDGEPKTRLKMYYANQDLARAAAETELRKRERGTVSVSVTLPGRTDLMAEGRLILKGFRAGVNGEWSIKRAEHSLGSGGYTTSVEAETPNTGSAPKVEDVAD
jgi:hypothetical protein